MSYIARLTAGKTALWCYFIWYLVFAARTFDPNSALWFTSLGIAAIIGVALVISTGSGRSQLDRWQVFRLFLMPFCVSSFSALVKGRGFILVFSPRLGEDALAIGCCAGFCALVAVAKWARR